MSTLAVVEQVLRHAAVPLTVAEIVRRAGGRLPTRSRTPDSVVARDLAMDLVRHGEHSRFVRVAVGVYTLRELAPDAECVRVDRPRRSWVWTPEARQREVLRRRRLERRART